MSVRVSITQLRGRPVAETGVIYWHFKYSDAGKADVRL